MSDFSGEEFYKERLQLRIDEVSERIERLEDEKESLINSHDTEHRLFEDRMERNDVDTKIFQQILIDIKERFKNIEDFN